MQRLGIKYGRLYIRCSPGRWTTMAIGEDVNTNIRSLIIINT